MSNLLEQASVIITPNAYKEGKLYGLKGTDLDVVRATTATRVNADGLIEEVPYNLLQRSEEFDNAVYTLARVSAFGSGSVANTTETLDPSGNNNADLLQQAVGENSSGGAFQFFSAVLGTTYTISVFAKTKNQRYLRLGSGIGLAGAAVFCGFDLQTGEIGTPDSGVSASITQLNNGWYRCSVTITSQITGSRGVFFYQSANLNSAVTTPLSSLYLYGAQLVQGTQPKEYLRTETRLNIPRLDYTNGSCPSILVEPQRTNLVLRSEEFDNASWVKSNLNVTANNTISPDGNNSADKLVEDTATANHLITQAAGGSGVQTYAISVFAKSFSGDRYLQIWVGNTINAAAWIRLDLDNGTITQDNGIAGTGYSIASSSIQDFGNGWYKCVLVANKLNTTGTNTIQFRLSQISTGAESNSYLGNGTSGLYLWGAQLEAGSNATSYIPTVASAVTRNADVISKTGIADLIGQSEGSVFVDVKVSNLNSDLFLFNLNLVNNIIIGVGSGNIRTTIYANSVAYNFTNFLISNNNLKIAVGYKSGDSVLYINGVLISTLTSVFSFSGLLNDIYINRSFIYGNNSNNYNSVSVSKTRLSNDELQQITTL